MGEARSQSFPEDKKYQNHARLAAIDRLERNPACGLLVRTQQFVASRIIHICMKISRLTDD